MSAIQPGDNRPLSELFRLASEEWVDHDAAARMLEELKSTFLEQKKAERVQQASEIDGTNLPDSHAEREVKATVEWKDYVVKMVSARTRANRAKAQLEYLRMKYWEQSGVEASKRAEMRMGG
jgi:hypothetical protein